MHKTKASTAVTVEACVIPPKEINLTDQIVSRTDQFEEAHNEHYGHIKQLERQLSKLSCKQRDWLDLQFKLDEAASLLEDNNIRTQREPWCWNDSPHANEIANIEKALEV